MPSPFPGMNPYIEQDVFWQDFHLEFLPAMRERLVAQVRPKYIVMLDEHSKSAAHFVEIDLLRGGRPMPVERRPRCDYCVMVSRAEARPWAGLCPPGCANDCRSSPSRCLRGIRMRRSISRRSSTTSMMRRAMKILSTPASLIPCSLPRMRPGPERSCRRETGRHSPNWPSA